MNSVCHLEAVTENLYNSNCRICNFGDKYQSFCTVIVLKEVQSCGETDRIALYSQNKDLKVNLRSDFLLLE